MALRMDSTNPINLRHQLQGTGDFRHGKRDCSKLVRKIVAQNRISTHG